MGTRPSAFIGVDLQQFAYRVGADVYPTLDHAAEHEHLYRRAVPMHRTVVDLRDPAPEVVDLTADLDYDAVGGLTLRRQTP